MKMIRYTASILLLLPLLLVSCVREAWPDAGGKDGEWVIPFTVSASPDIVVSTKSTMTNPESEKVIYNLYVLVFDNNGGKLHGHFFDDSSKNLANTTGIDDYWTLPSETKDPSDPTKSLYTGTIHLKSSKNETCNDATIVVITNLNSEMVNISPEQLNTVMTFAELEALTAKLNQQILSRSGYFPMCGKAEHVNLSSTLFSLTTPITLRRLDAKVEFKVHVKKDVPSDPNNRCFIYDFTPLSWQVINLPKHCSVLEKTTDSAVKAADFFNGEENGFETETLTNSTSDTYYDNTKRICYHGFSFYMMENRKSTSGKASPGTWEYKHRDTRTGDTFTYVNDLATYVILKGRIELHTPSAANPSVMEIKRAEVKYIIHLGNFDADLSNFDIKRNNSYIYDIEIVGVNDIKAYVLENKNDEPGASGEIVFPLRKIFVCDSHYSAHAIDLYYKDIKGKTTLDWWVKTPFNPNGAHAGEAYVDSDWVEFRVNTKSGSVYPPNTITTYKPRTDPGTMTVTELMQFLLDEKTKFESPDGEIKASSAFDNQDNEDKAKITVTAFVNEYYYEKNPLTGRPDKDLWRTFVNAKTREMCLLSTDETRGESRYVEGAYIFQQHSIQSPYNINHPDLNSGWGAEYEIDKREEKCNGPYTKNATNPKERGNTNPDNGRRNSMIEWGLMGTDVNSFTFDNNKSWNNYLLLTDDNDSNAFMVSSVADLRHSCMSRNRDNNGNGKIDEDEIRWYMASSNQLINLFLGSYGLEAGAGLYQRTAEQRQQHNGAKGKWRYHVLASDRVNYQTNSNTSPRVVWSEECFTGSTIQGIDQNGAEIATRCVRNFGYDPALAWDEHHGQDISYSPVGRNGKEVVPDYLIDVKRYHDNGTYQDDSDDTSYAGDWKSNYQDVFFEVDCSRINEKSLRYFTDRELVQHDEFAEAACLYKYFRTTSINGSNTWTSDRYVSDINEDLDNGTGAIQFCPDGYRLPNIRELGIMCYFFNMTTNEAEVYIRNTQNTGNDPRIYTFARTRFSFGKSGAKFDNSHWGWAIGRDGRFKGLMAGSKSDNGNYKTHSIRCVKDVKTLHQPVQ